MQDLRDGDSWHLKETLGVWNVTLLVGKSQSSAVSLGSSLCTAEVRNPTFNSFYQVKCLRISSHYKHDLDQLLKSGWSLSYPGNAQGNRCQKCGNTHEWSSLQ